MGDKAIKTSFNLAHELRKKDFMVVMETLRRSLKSQMKEANKLDSQFVIIIGDDEMKNQKAIIKNMETGNQSKVPFNKINSYFKK